MLSLVRFVDGTKCLLITLCMLSIAGCGTSPREQVTAQQVAQISAEEECVSGSSYAGANAVSWAKAKNFLDDYMGKTFVIRGRIKGSVFKDNKERIFAEYYDNNSNHGGYFKFLMAKETAKEWTEYTKGESDLYHGVIACEITKMDNKEHVCFVGRICGIAINGSLKFRSSTRVLKR